jgi:alkanesulfonate monooxygenase SsuD/methylene tetrahydromethanopterin reductase-like flavin-dependent oxidoreductase (luciferase family)
VKVGIVLPQSAAEGGDTWREILAVARQAEAGGIDSLWVCDHFLYRPAKGPENGYHEPMTLLTALAASTERVALGSLVLATSFRSPGILAKMTAILDDVADQRLILGLGCGWHEPEYLAFGYPFDHRVGRFEETLAVVAPLLAGERVTFKGRWTEVDDAVVLPAPRRRVPILVAAEGDRMLHLSARYADFWQTAWYGRPDERWTQRLDRFRAACDAEGRDGGSLGLTVGVDVHGSSADVTDEARHLPVDAGAIADGLAAWADSGVHHVQLGLEVCRPADVDVVVDALSRLRA